MKIWLAVVASLLLIPAVAWLAEATDKNRIVVNWVCEDQKWDCSKVKTPIIVVSRIVPQQYYGLYFSDEPYIFLTVGLSPEQAKETLVHETAHYVIDQLDLTMTKCDNEGLVREITARVLTVEIDETWRTQYGCPVTPP